MLSQKTKRYVLEAEWAGRIQLIICVFGQCSTGQNRTKPGQGRVGQSRMMTGEAVFLGLNTSDISIDPTKV